jgi:DNA ligase (NAD+)
MDNYEEMSIVQLKNTLVRWQELYYAGIPEVTDSIFDYVEELLKLKDPKNNYFDKVGSNNVRHENKIRHKYPMLSMDKVAGIVNIDKWFTKCGLLSGEDGDIIIEEPKIDGNSCSLIYIDGKLHHGVRRGNGIFGEIIHWIGKQSLKSIPEKINVKFPYYEVRGEMVIYKKHAKEPIFKDSPLRNAASGLITRGGPDIKYLTFVAYQALGVEYEKESDVLYDLTNLGFEVVQHNIVRCGKNITRLYEDYLETGRDKLPYETDGIVCIVDDKKMQESIDKKYIIRHHHIYNIAIKPPSLILDSKLLDVKYNVSKDGTLVPVAIYEPIMFGQTMYQQANLVNLSNIYKLAPKLLKGSRIVIKRANDVIPQILHIDIDGKGGEIKIPTVCPICGEPISKSVNVKSGVSNLKCTNPQCKGILSAKIYSFISKIKIKGIGDKTIEEMVMYDVIKTPLDLFSSDLKQKLLNLPTKSYQEGGAKLNNIFKALNSVKGRVEDIDILAAIGIPGIGEPVLKTFGLNSITNLRNQVLNSNKMKKDSVVFITLSNWIENKNNMDLIVGLKEVLK